MWVGCGELLFVGADLTQRLVPDGLWDLVAPLLPSFASRPQGGGTALLDERAVFTAVVYVVTSGCAWRHLPPTFGVSSATAHRRLTAWTKAGLWRCLHRAVLDELGAHGELDWSSVITDAASVRTGKRGVADRAAPGRPRQIRQQTAPPVRGPGHPAGGRCLRREHPRQPGPQTPREGDTGCAVPARTRRRHPGKLRADKAYHSADQGGAPAYLAAGAGGGQALVGADARGSCAA